MTNDESVNPTNTSPIAENAPRNSPEFPIPADDSLSSASLTEAQTAAIELLLTGVKPTHAANQLHIDRKTLYTWRTHNPAFRAELQSRRDQLLAETSDRFRNLLHASLDTLELHVRDRYAPTAHRAARTLLTLARIGDYIAPAAPQQATPTEKE